MNYFYLYFIIGYYFYSVLGLIVDIFTIDNRINSINIFSVKKNYIQVSNLVNMNVLLRSIPFFCVAELMYINYNEGVSYTIFLCQYIVTLILGINLEYLFHRLRHTKYLYKYHSKHHNQKVLFGYMTFYEHPYDFYLSMMIIIFPALLRFSPLITHSWILLYLYKTVILDHCNLFFIGKHYNLHHELKTYNYGIKYIDNVCDTLNNDYSILKKKNDDIKESDIKALPPLNNYKCYSYLCKTNDKEKIKHKLGELHYSNFF
jgi:sterol desaturase/sphingolipid hydroxylase (fatty acid hydroxylase superfamily)